MPQLWNQILARLSDEIPEQQFNTWLRPLQAEHEGGVLRLLGPNRFAVEWVQANAVPRIQSLLRDAQSNDALVVEIGTRAPPPAPAVNGHGAVNGTGAAPRAARRHEGGLQICAKLSPELTFDRFVEGKSNHFAKAAAMQVAENPGKGFNPLLIYGGTGLGKTHLMQAVGHVIRQHDPEARVAYVHSERFVDDMVQSLRHNKMNEFKSAYRSLSALLIDDIQFFAGKQQSQEEFFHTFNTLFEGQAQIVMTSDRYPREIPGLEDRLKTRLGWGLSVAIEPPELETSVAILISKAQAAGMHLPEEVAFFVAKRIRSNVRELEGALHRIIASSRFTGQPISIDFTKEVLKDLLNLQARLVTVENIQKTVAEYYKLRLADLASASRSQSIARPRQLAMALAKELTTQSYPEIGRAFGRDHTTVMHACDRVKELRESDSRVSEDYSNLSRILQA